MGQSTNQAEDSPGDGSEASDALPSGSDVVGRHRGLTNRTALISALTLVSRVLGYVREGISALLFGHASIVYDAFLTAWRVPNMFRRFLGEGALSTSLQTAITEEDDEGGDEAGRALFRDTLRWAVLCLVTLCVLVMALVSIAGDTMPVTGWHWMGEDPGAVREFVLRLTPYLVFICLAALSSGALQVRGHFAVPALGPVAMNLVWIAALVLIGMHFGWSDDGQGGPGFEQRTLSMARVLSWGVLLSGFVQLLMQGPALQRHGLAPWGKASGTSRRRGVDVLKRAAPLALGAAVYQINVMVDGLMAVSMLEKGGATTLYYANRIQQLPLALVAIAATNAVFPSLKAFGHRREWGSLRSLHTRTHLAIVFVALPAGVGLWVLSEPVVSVLLERGAFEREGVVRSAAALRMLCISLVPAGAVGLCSRAFYAVGDFKTPVRVSAWMLVANIALNVLFVRGLGMDVAGLALATAISTWGHLLMLLPLLERRLPDGAGHDGGGTPIEVPARLLKIVAASLVCGFAAWGVRSGLGRGVGDPWALLAACLGGGAAFAVAARVLRLPEWEVLSSKLLRKRR